MHVVCDTDFSFRKSSRICFGDAPIRYQDAVIVPGNSNDRVLIKAFGTSRRCHAHIMCWCKMLSTEEQFLIRIGERYPLKMNIQNKIPLTNKTLKDFLEEFYVGIRTSTQMEVNRDGNQS